MVDPDKVYLMTKAALFEKKEEKNALKIVSYRRKDYILYHMLLVFLSVTAGYAIIVGMLLFMIVMAYESWILNVTEMIGILAAVILGYLVVQILYYMISHKIYGEKHVKARQDVKKYLTTMRQLKHYQEKTEREGEEA